MTITGRTTADAVVNETRDGRKVVNFSIAVNETYKPKGGERVKVTSFFHCSYWISEKIAEFLKKGTMVEVFGRVFASAYVDRDGTPQASLNCHVNHIKLLSGPKPSGPATASKEAVRDTADDLPL